MIGQSLSGKLLVTSVILLLCLYFIVEELLQSYFQSQLNSLHESTPIIFDRYRYIMLAYALLSERILYNNSLSTFESQPHFGSNLDLYYLEKSIENEGRIESLKHGHEQIASEVVSYLNAIDSQDFCAKIIGGTSTVKEAKEAGKQQSISQI
jgi:hypothetical protein